MKRGSGLASSLVSAATSFLRKIPVGTVINTAIDALPVELHLPGGYQYCGPGTKLQQRLRRGDPGINQLDRACKVHDIAYSNTSDTVNRTIADKELASRAWERVKAGDATLGEKAAALSVVGAMKAKTVFGGGRKLQNRKKNSRKCRKGGNIKKKKTRSKKKNVKASVWSMVKAGRGLYLKPYRVY